MVLDNDTANDNRLTLLSGKFYYKHKTKCDFRVLLNVLNVRICLCFNDVFHILGTC